MFDAFDLPFVQRGLWAVLLLAIPGGLLGTWIVLRSMAFYAHATGTAAFPGLVVADGLGFAAPLGALAAAALFAGGVVALGGRRRTGGDSLVALVLVGGLAAVEGTVGLWLAVETNAPPGATIAVVAGAGFALVSLSRARRAMALPAVALLLAVGVAGCGGVAAGGGRPTVVASTTQIADF